MSNRDGDGHRRVRGQLSLCFCLLMCEGEKDREVTKADVCMHMPACVPAHVCVFVDVSVLALYLRSGVCPVTACGFNALH